MLSEMIKPIVDLNEYIEFTDKMNSYELGLISHDEFIEVNHDELKSLYINKLLQNDVHIINKSFTRFVYQSWIHYCYYIYREKMIQTEIYNMLFKD